MYYVVSVGIYSFLKVLDLVKSGYILMSSIVYNVSSYSFASARWYL